MERKKMFGIIHSVFKKQIIFFFLYYSAYFNLFCKIMVKIRLWTENCQVQQQGRPYGILTSKKKQKKGH